MKFPRASGILLHPTSLPGAFGLGDLGPEAHAFVEFLHRSGMKIWQVLPLSPTGYGDSPYASFSAFAGNPLLISPERLVGDGLLTQADLDQHPPFTPTRVDFAKLVPWKQRLLRRAFDRFHPSAAYHSFCERESHWLPEFARYVALKHANGLLTWTEWTTSIHDEAEAEYQRFLQFCFFTQWNDLKRHCEERRIRVMGDIPIYVAHDSADVWAHPDLFELDPRGNPLRVSGVPPDYFSATGQLWGNPLFNWQHMEQTGFAWWIERFRATFSMVDMVRLDHFRGFEAYWAVPAGEPTAVNGEWVHAPGEQLFTAIEDALGSLPIVAENLGVITPPVERLRERFGFPGMSILQFAFGGDPQAASFRPHNYPRNVVAYTGTHDNETTVGWWESAGVGDSTRSQADVDRERSVAYRYLNFDGRDVNWVFIRALMASVAGTVLIPMQDILGLGNEARMNTPATTGRNWKWRMEAGALTPALESRLRELTNLYER